MMVVIGVGVLISISWMVDNNFGRVVFDGSNVVGFG